VGGRQRGVGRVAAYAGATSASSGGCQGYCLDPTGRDRCRIPTARNLRRGTTLALQAALYLGLADAAVCAAGWRTLRNTDTQVWGWRHRHRHDAGLSVHRRAARRREPSRLLNR
jgi:hypothetical protein